MLYGSTSHETAERERLRLLRKRSEEAQAVIDAPAKPPPVTPICEWIETHFYIPELRGPLQLAPYQRRNLEAIFPDPAAALPYSLVVWSDIKKSIKSTIAAAVVLYWADMFPWSSCKIIANDLKQAESRVAFYLRRAITLNPDYFVKERGAVVRNYNVTLGNHSKIEAIPIDPDGEAGGNDDIIVYSELWGAKGDQAKRMWTELTLSPMKFGRSLRWVETYAGFEGESELLEPLYQENVKPEHQLWDDEPYVFANKRTFCMWNKIPRLPWQIPDYYEQEKATLLPGEFARVHENEWGTSEEAFVPGEWIDACLDTSVKPLDPYDPIVLALDAGVSSDLFSLTGTSRHPDNDQHTLNRFCFEWEPPKGGKITFSLATDDENTYETEEKATPFAVVLWICKVYNVVEVAYDPYQLHDMTTKLRAMGINCREFPQGIDRLKADKRFYDNIRDRQFHHTGDVKLINHIKQANAKKPDDKSLRIVKRPGGKKIDHAVSQSMGNDRCLRLNLA